MQAEMPNQPNPEFLRRAIALATDNVISGRGGPFAALIVRDGKIVAEGVNMVTATNDPTAHGEVSAIRAACKALGTFTLAGCELYTSCEPCPMCLAASHWARLDAVFFGAARRTRPAPDLTTPFSMKSSARTHPPGLLPTTQFLRDEAWASFRGVDCFAKQNRILTGWNLGTEGPKQPFSGLFGRKYFNAIAN